MKEVYMDTFINIAIIITLAARGSHLNNHQPYAAIQCDALEPENSAPFKGGASINTYLHVTDIPRVRYHMARCSGTGKFALHLN